MVHRRDNRVLNLVEASAGKPMMSEDRIAQQCKYWPTCEVRVIDVRGIGGIRANDVGNEMRKPWSLRIAKGVGVRRFERTIERTLNQACRRIWIGHRDEAFQVRIIVPEKRGQDDERDKLVPDEVSDRIGFRSQTQFRLKPLRMLAEIVK
ncbi:hypothetical protein GOB57_09350 [Sinorhizobium meliloti]|nr:hypothetical protein [Sinorhizobium meliloti]